MCTCKLLTYTPTGHISIDTLYVHYRQIKIVFVLAMKQERKVSPVSLVSKYLIYLPTMYVYCLNGSFKYITPLYRSHIVLILKTLILRWKNLDLQYTFCTSMLYI